MNGRAERHIVAIDGLRFACAMAVLAYHFWTIFPIATSSPTRLFGMAAALPTGAAAWTASGWIGVEIFFVISGYVIAISAEQADRAAFARGRILRLAPAGLICAVLSAAVLALSGALPVQDTAIRLAATVTMLPFGPRIDGVWWTLQVETGFYILVACVLRGDRRNNARLWRLGVCLTLWSLVYYAQTIASGDAPDRAGAPATLVLMPHGMLFALGIALRAIATKGWSPGRVAAGAAALAVALVEVVRTGAAYDGAGGVAQSLAIPVALFLAGILVIVTAPRWRASPRTAAALRKLGALTYPLYLVNHVIGAATVAGLVAIGCPAGAALILAAVAMVALAAVVGIALEPRVRGRLAVLMAQARKEPQALPPAALDPRLRGDDRPVAYATRSIT